MSYPESTGPCIFVSMQFYPESITGNANMTE
ncbi:hypothetical protein SAMN04488128_104198 [Chitinophaga eiseniae]|uniref:Uncharacterized protein n=1 Tax=Chitinophaga eiseniae TaxID=634771 RepID=A0A1T4T9B0_9BACT|nr:hypothetical protein SAMN04488128_104198 [Chitinophaga eiseniae]